MDLAPYIGPVSRRLCAAEHAFLSQYLLCFFVFNDTATTEIYTLSLHDALPIRGLAGRRFLLGHRLAAFPPRRRPVPDRKSTRLNSSHVEISYAVFCLKKKKKKNICLSLQNNKKKKKIIKE